MYSDHFKKIFIFYREQQNKVYKIFLRGEYNRISDDELYEIVKYRFDHNNRHIVINKSDYVHNIDLVCSIFDRTKNIICNVDENDIQNTFTKTHERCYWILHNMYDYNKCEICGSPITTYGKCSTIGYRSVCSNPVCGTAKASRNRANKNLVIFRKKLSDHEYELIDDVKNRQCRAHIKHNKCGCVFDINLANIFMNGNKKSKFNNIEFLCPVCNPRENLVSKWELEVRDFISNHIDINNLDFNNRILLDPYEIDILSEKYHIGIECNGATMHSSERKGDKLHLWKTNMAMTKGVNLYHFMDYEWYCKQDVVKSYILRLFNKVSDVIETVNINRIEFDILNEFVDENSLDSVIESENNFGLYRNGELIGTFSYVSDKDNIRLVNVSEKNYVVILKMYYNIFDYLKYLNKDIVLHVNRRFHPNKDDYERYGFKLVKTENPNKIVFNSISEHRINDAYFNGRLTKEYIKENYIFKPDNPDIMNEFYDSGTFIFHKKY